MFFSFFTHPWHLYMTSCQTLRMNVSSGCSRSSSVVLRMVFSNSQFLSLSTSRPGNRSPSRPKKIVTSSVTIFGMLKSLRARIRTWEAKYTYRIHKTILLSLVTVTLNEYKAYLVFRPRLVSSSQRPCHNQDRLDSTQTPVIVVLMVKCR